MAEDVQGLLEKIHKDGIAKAQQEKEAMLAEAKKEAARLVSEAKTQADELIRKAQTETQATQEKANAAIRQAARDMVIALKADLLARLNTVAHSCVSETVNPEIMKQIVLKMADAYGKGGRDAAGSLEILLPKKEQEQTEAYLKAKLLAELKADPVIRLTHEFNSGLQISFQGEDVYFDFSDDALAEVLCRFVGPKLTAVIKG